MGLSLNLKTACTNYKEIEAYICNIPDTQTLQIIYDNAEKQKVPFCVLLGIYIIETTNRTIVYRWIEYILTFFIGFFSFLFKIRIKNYTVGVCQIGLGNILLMNFNKDKRYDKYFIINSFSEYKAIIKGFNKKNNIKLAAILIKEFILESGNMNPNRQIRYIGQIYNGRMEYGILLSKIVQALNEVL